VMVLAWPVREICFEASFLAAGIAPVLEPVEDGPERQPGFPGRGSAGAHQCHPAVAARVRIRAIPGIAAGDFGEYRHAKRTRGRHQLLHLQAPVSRTKLAIGADLAVRARAAGSALRAVAVGSTHKGPGRVPRRARGGWPAVGNDRQPATGPGPMAADCASTSVINKLPLIRRVITSQN
jgi:hypothetical protein